LQDYDTSPNIKKHLPADYADFADASAHCLNQDLQDLRICRIMVHHKKTNKRHAGSIFLDNKPILPADYADFADASESFKDASCLSMTFPHFVLNKITGF